MVCLDRKTKKSNVFYGRSNYKHSQIEIVTSSNWRVQPQCMILKEKRVFSLLLYCVEFFHCHVAINHIRGSSQKHISESKKHFSYGHGCVSFIQYTPLYIKYCAAPLSHCCRSYISVCSLDFRPLKLRFTIWRRDHAASSRTAWKAWSTLCAVRCTSRTSVLLSAPSRGMQRTLEPPKKSNVTPFCFSKSKFET